jgi:flagellar basal body-associated protein FliL
MMIIAIVAACAAAGIAAFFYMKKFKKPAGAKKEEPKAEKGAKPKPNKCPKCSANVPAGDTFCSVCGERIIPPD